MSPLQVSALPLSVLRLLTVAWVLSIGLLSAQSSCGGTLLDLPVSGSGVAPPLINTTTCQAIRVTPLSGWNVVGIQTDRVASQANWNLRFGSITSTRSGANTDFLVAHGREGAPPRRGDVFRVTSGASDVYAKHGSVAPLSIGGAPINHTWRRVDSIVRGYEFFVPSTRRFRLEIQGSTDLSWTLYREGLGLGWHRRTTSLLTGNVAASITTSNPGVPLLLNRGWHFIVIHRDGAPASSNGFFSIAVKNEPAQVFPGGITRSNGAVPSLIPTRYQWTLDGANFFDDGPGDKTTFTVDPTKVEPGTTTTVNIVSSTRTIIESTLRQGEGGASIAIANPGTAPILAIPRTRTNVSTTAPNPVPSVSRVTVSGGSTSIPRFASARRIVVEGSGFIPTSGVLVNGSAVSVVSRVRSGSTDVIQADVPSGFFASAGSLVVQVRNGTPGGGDSSGNSSLTVVNPAPVTGSLGPTQVTVGSGSLTLTVIGSGFVPESVVRIGSSNRPTTYVNGGRLTASVSSSFFTSATTFSVRVINPGPGGGTSGSQTLTVANPLPVLGSISPSAVPLGSSTRTVTVTGSGFVSSSVIRVNGGNRTTTFVSSTQLRANVASQFFSSAGTLSIDVVSPTPGGGTSATRSLEVQNPVPVISGISPVSVVAGIAPFDITITGSNFVPQSIVKLGNFNLTTTYVSSTELRGLVQSRFLGAPSRFNMTVLTPAPGGGQTSSISLFVASRTPLVSTLSPASLPIATPGDPDQIVTIDGTGMLPTTQAFAGDDALAVTYIDATRLEIAIPASLDQSQLLGAHAITLLNDGSLTSNAVALPVGGVGSNAATYRRDPVAPQPGDAYTALFQGGVAGQPMSVLVDLQSPFVHTVYPIPGIPNDFILNLRPFVIGAPDWFVLTDGTGIYGGIPGFGFDAAGEARLSGITLPNPAVGLSLTIQGAYFDPSSPVGFRMTWARFPERF